MKTNSFHQYLRNLESFTAEIESKEQEHRSRFVNNLLPGVTFVL